MAKKNLTDMSSQELYELARQREEQEEAQEKEAMRAKLEELREERRQIQARHRKELAAIEAEIRAHGGRTGTRGGGRRRANGGTSITDQVLEIVHQSQEISTKEIKAQLEERGVVANNLAQTLAYLKKQGKVASPARSVYTPA
jgi:hypothetical protein